MQITLSMFLLVAVSLSGWQAPPSKSQTTRQAFDHYEAVRVALAADKFQQVGAHAKELAPLAAAIGGAKAKAAGEQLVAAKNIEAARTAFGDLSEELVPLFQAEKIEGVSAFFCSMKNRTWVQRGDKIENPYYGASMLACGSALAPPKK
jgi:hypothetical protein